jgi:hypothetical protein
MLKPSNEDLHSIACDAAEDETKGSFIQLYAKAYLYADDEQADAMRPLWYRLVIRYGYLERMEVMAK